EDFVDLPDGLEGDRRDRRLRLAARRRGDIGKLEELASRMGPAGCFDDRTRLSLRLVDRVEARICVGLENAGVSGEMPLGMLAAAIGRIEVHCSWSSGAAERLIVAHIGPYTPGPRLHFGEHRHRGVVTVDPLGSEHV